MNQVPVDVDLFMADVVAILDVVPVVDNRTKEQQTDRDNRPKWRLELLVSDDNNRKSVVTVGFAADTAPEVTPGTAPQFDGLTARYWDFNGRSGLSLTASRVRFPSQPAAPTAA